MARYPSSLVFAILIALFAFAVGAEPVSVPVGSTLTVDVGVPIRSVEVDPRDTTVCVQKVSTRVFTITAVRVGPVPVKVTTANGPVRLDVQVLSKKKELSSADLEQFLADNP